jgi:hypothetical protein
MSWVSIQQVFFFFNEFTENHQGSGDSSIKSPSAERVQLVVSDCLLHFGHS